MFTIVVPRAVPYDTSVCVVWSYILQLCLNVPTMLSKRRHALWLIFQDWQLLHSWQWDSAMSKLTIFTKIIVLVEKNLKLKVVTKKVKVSVFRLCCTCYLKLRNIDKSQRQQQPSTRLSKVSSSNPAVSWQAKCNSMWEGYNTKCLAFFLTCIPTQCWLKVPLSSAYTILTQ